MAGESFQASEIQNWYKIYTDAISRASNFTTKPTAPTQGMLGLAPYINDLATVISAFKEDSILSKDTTVTYKTVNTVSVGQLIQRSTADQIIAGGNVLAVVKCRNSVTYSNSSNNQGDNSNGDNSNGAKSNSSHPNGDCSYSTNFRTCSNGANKNGGYSHGNCSSDV